MSYSTVNNYRIVLNQFIKYGSELKKVPYKNYTTTLIYAYADTEAKRIAIQRTTANGMDSVAVTEKTYATTDAETIFVWNLFNEVCVEFGTNFVEQNRCAMACPDYA